jgi:hypothetical protein
MLLNVFRPKLQENVSAVPQNGGNYSFLINFTSKSISIIAAAITALDAIATVIPLFHEADSTRADTAKWTAPGDCRVEYVEKTPQSRI